MDKNPEISIITPVYNVDKYLRKCLDSILSQTFSDFELIIVDDGSTDNSGKIADEVAELDKRVKVIHKSNGGAPSARNAGISTAKGNYFYFPDSDDWLEKDYLEKLYKLAKKTNSQLVISGYTMEFFEKGKCLTCSVTNGEKLFGNKNEVRANIHKYLNNMMVAVPWNKLFDANYIRKNNYLFPNVKWDDLHFNLEVLSNISSVSISSSSGYHFFRSRMGSETTLVFDGQLFKKRKEQFEHILKIYEQWNVDDPDIMEEIYSYYTSRLVQCVQEISISNIQNKIDVINSILSDPLTIIALKNGRSKSILFNILEILLKLKNPYLCLIAGKLIGFIKSHFTILFFALKSKFVNKATIR